MAGSDACLVKWKRCDEQSQTCPGPWDDLYGGCIGHAPAWIAAVAGAGAGAECISKRTYQELMPTIRQAARLTVRERDKRFAPAITGAFDLATMTRLAVGPAWKNFSPAQQTAVQEAFTQISFVTDYASQINDYSGESFVVDPQTSPTSRGGGEIVKTRLLQPGGRTVNINYLVRGGRVIDVYLNGTISDLATRRDEFTSIIASGGADGLIKRLQDRTQSLFRASDVRVRSLVHRRAAARGGGRRAAGPGLTGDVASSRLSCSGAASDQFHHRNGAA